MIDIKQGKELIDSLVDKLFLDRDKLMVLSYAYRKYLDLTPYEVAKYLSISQIEVNQRAFIFTHKANYDPDLKGRLNSFKKHLDRSFTTINKNNYKEHLQTILER